MLEPEWRSFIEYYEDRGYSAKSLATYQALFGLWKKIMGHNVIEFVRKAKENPEFAESEVMKYVRARRTSCSVPHLQNMRSALTLICKANKVKVDWESIPLPKGLSRNKKCPYRKEETRSLLENVTCELKL